jgi:transposase
MKTQMKFIYIIEEFMNAYLYASNLAHITRRIAWNAAKRGVAATRVKSAYSSQECSVCHNVE